MTGAAETRVTQVAEKQAAYLVKYSGWYQSIGPAVTLVTVRR